MKKISIILIALASFAILLGLLIFVGIMTDNGWDFSKVSSSKPVINTYEFTEEMTDLAVITDTADINFIPSQDSKIKVVCYESENLKHNVILQDGKIKIGISDTRKWYHYVFNFTKEKIDVYLPEKEYSSLTVDASTGNVKISEGFRFANLDVSISTGDVETSAETTVKTKIKTTTGNVKISNARLATLDVSVSTGDVTLSGINGHDLSVSVTTGKVKVYDVFSESFTTTGNTGDVKMSMLVTGSLSINRTTGDVTFESCDASEIKIETDTGDVKGSFMSSKIFSIKTSTGDVEVPDTTKGGICKITTTTGDVEIKILNKA